MLHLAAATVALSAIVAVSGCSASAPASEDTATSGEINWWGWTPEIGVGQKYIEAFNEEYPDIEVTYKQVATSDYDSAIRPALASNVGPDVFNMAPGGGIGSVQAYGDFAIDLEPAVEEALGADWADKISPLGVDGLTDKDGRLAALPVGSTFAGTVWYNPAIFDKFGLTMPTTLDEWIDVCEKFTAEGQTCFEQGAADNGFNQDLVHAIAETIEPGVWASAVEGDLPWTDPVLVEAFTIFQDMFDNGIMQPGALGMQQYPDVNNDFISGEVAMVLMGTWYMQYSTVDSATAAVDASGVAGAAPFPIVAAPFPDVAGAGNPAPLFGDADFGVAVNVKSKYPKAAQTFATWLTTSDTAQQVVSNALNQIASLSSITPEWDGIDLVEPQVQQPVLDELLSRAAVVTDPRLGNVDTVTGQAIGAALQSVATNSETPQDALATLDSAVAGD
ncbi:ABC transporter substrate-binding protein (plasmid) [Coraliomargarita sp. W4R53]